MKRGRNQLETGAIELIEEAVHLLRRSPLSTLAIYYAGALPFILGLLYFWTDMSRSPFADQHLAGGALGVGLLFLWMKLCQNIFARRLRLLIAGESPERLSFRRFCRTVVFQTVVQSTGLFLLPLALILTLPFAWVYAFYQNFTALDDGQHEDLRRLVGKAQELAMLAPKQNHLLLSILFGFGLFVFLNWSILWVMVPGLLKTLLGIESLYSRSVLSLLNSTFFAIMFGLAYLSVDPIVKTAYVLRCFYGQSKQSGEDLKVELRQYRLSRAVNSIAIALFLMLIPQGNSGAADTGSRPEEQGKQAPVSLPESRGQLAPNTARQAELDRTIQEVLQQQKYTWRMPRDSVERRETGKGLFGRFFDRVRHWIRSVRDWIVGWLRKLFHLRPRSDESSSGYGWILTLQLLLYLLIAVVVAALAILVVRALRGRGSKRVVVTGEAIQPAPDLRDEAIGADRLPEDGWSNLGRELLEKGELRLALRAFYLASLAHLASRQLIGLAKFKSNRDYEHELRRRGHSFPGLLTLFADNVMVFDSVWYGMHNIDNDLVQQFIGRVEQIRAQEA